MLSKLCHAKCMLLRGALGGQALLIDSLGQTLDKSLVATQQFNLAVAAEFRSPTALIVCAVGAQLFRLRQCCFSGGLCL